MSLIDFLFPTSPYLLLGVVLSISTLAIVGTFAYLQKKELAGDVVSHALLLGIAIAFALTHVKNTAVLSLGGFLSGTLALFLIDYLGRINPKIKQDTAMALVLSSFFGVGMMILSYIQHNVYEDQSGLEAFLLGNIAGLTDRDVNVFLGLAVVLLAILLALFKEWRLICFDQAYARSIGWPVHILTFIFRTITVAAIVLSIQMVGIVLMTSLLIIPAVAAHYWTQRLHILIFIAALVASLSGIIGIAFSFHISDMPTGPCIVLVSVCLMLLSCFLAPQKGIIANKWRLYQYHKRILSENLLKVFYEMACKDSDQGMPRTLTNIIHQRNMSVSKVRKGMKTLCQQGLAEKLSKDQWKLTQAGYTKGRSILERHLLWEAYLQKFLNIQDNHVHDDAEAVEHLITPELEQLLREALQRN